MLDRPATQTAPSRVLADAPAAYVQAARELLARSDAGLKPAKVVCLGTYTLDLLVPYLVVKGAERGLRLDVSVGPFNQVHQQLLDLRGETNQATPDVILVATRLEDFLPNLGIELLSNGADSALRQIQGAVDSLLGALHEARRNSQAQFVILNFAPPRGLAAGMADAGAAYSQASLVQTANQRLAEGCRKIGGAYIADWAGFVGQVGQENWFDAKIWYWTRNPFKREAMPRVAIFVARAIAAALRPACKCLVLDLDNTLWGGVLGEDGLDGIKLGGNYPGNVYQDFQRYILQLRHRGVLLALASKNNPEDVAQAFREHGEFILKLDDFAACQIHWEDKATSLRRIAAQLNIGLDSLAFFDDNPVERELVRLLAPEVKIIEAPVSPIDFAAAIEGCGLFDQYVISAEDRARHGMYQANQEREALRLQSADLNSFLADLRMSAQISPIDAVNAERVAQLIAKTNQFNLTLRRHSRSTVDKMLSSGAIGLSMRLSDRFGDHGLIAVAIAVPRGVSWEIDTFLMSCRVLGRQADTYLLAELIGQIRRRGGVEVCGLYVNGPKNQQVADFYLRHGFGAVEEQPGAFLWSAQKQSAIEHPGFIEAIAI